MLKWFRMALTAIALLISLAEGVLAGLPGMFQSPGGGDCTEWHECRERALAAAARGDYETFHNLAWRAVQTGPGKDASLLYLLARAQCLSGRPHDALVMLQRLADMGVATDAATNDDFARSRQLPGWPDVEAKILAIIRRGSAPLVSSDSFATASSTAAATPRLSVSALSPSAVAIHFSTEQFSVSGLAYDAVSERFVVGDRLGRKLIVVDERSHHAMDLVGAASAGFLEIAAVEIDPKRGDLWVASAGSAGEGRLHKLQLVSGRPLRAFNVPADRGPVTFVDLAVTQTGTVFVLDRLAPQLFAFRSGGAALEPVARIDAADPVSVAAGREDGILFVAHRDGLSRIDVRSRTASRVATPRGVSLQHLERIRWRRTALIAVRIDDDGSRRILQLEMNGRGTAITRVRTLEVSTPIVGKTLALTVSGDDLVCLTADPDDVDLRPSSDVVPGRRAFVAYRIPLR